MSSSEFTCPKCSTRFRVEDQFLGRVAACPKADCGQKMKLAAAVGPDDLALQPDGSGSQNQRQQSTADSIPTATNAPHQSEREQDSAIRRKSAGPGSSIIGPRESGTERLARQNETARRRRAETPKSISIHPAWYGAVLGLLVGGGVLYAWTVANPAPDLTGKPSSEAAQASDDAQADSE